MSAYIDDFAVGATVSIHFTTNAATGGKVAPSDPFDLADIRIYKNTSPTQRTSTAGWTISSPFDTETGIHALSVDTSDDTDAGFYAAGNDYFVYLIPDTETVDSQSVAALIGHFSIQNRYKPVTSVTGLTAKVDTLISGVIESGVAGSFPVHMKDTNGAPVTLAAVTVRVANDTGGYAVVAGSATTTDANGRAVISYAAGVVTATGCVSFLMSATGANDVDMHFKVSS